MHVSNASSFFAPGRVLHLTLFRLDSFDGIKVLVIESPIIKTSTLVGVELGMITGLETNLERCCLCSLAIVVQWMGKNC